MARPQHDEEPKSMTLRLDRELSDRVKAVAEVEGHPVSDVIREAIAAHVERRRKDPKFRRLLEENLARHEHLLKMLAEG